MSKYLISPIFEFSTKFINALVEHHVDEDKRVLVYPIANGLRLRTMDMRLYVTVEVSGSMVHLEFLEHYEVDETLLPYLKKVPYTIHDIVPMVSKINGFFNKEWSIEKDA